MQSNQARPNSIEILERRPGLLGLDHGLQTQIVADAASLVDSPASSVLLAAN